MLNEFIAFFSASARRVDPVQKYSFPFTYQSSFRFYKRSVLSVHFVVETAGVTEIVTVSVSSPQRCRGSATIYTFSTLWKRQIGKKKRKNLSLSYILQYDEIPTSLCYNASIIFVEMLILKVSTFFRNSVMNFKYTLKCMDSDTWQVYMIHVNFDLSPALFHSLSLYYPILFSACVTLINLS